jgi:hypothetical protein
LRTRINLIAAAARVRPEVDLWPHIVGASGVLLADPGGQVDGAILVLHADGDAPARRMADHVLPRLAQAAGVPLGLVPSDGGEGPLRSGRWKGRPISLSLRGNSLRIAWGDSAIPIPGRPRTNPILRALAADERAAMPPQRFVALWPGRLAWALRAGASMGSTLAEAPPIVWVGTNSASGSTEAIRWAGVRPTIHGVLERLLADPPPAVGR